MPLYRNLPRGSLRNDPKRLDQLAPALQLSLKESRELPEGFVHCFQAKLGFVVTSIETIEGTTGSPALVTLTGAKADQHHPLPKGSR